MHWAACLGKSFTANRKMVPTVQLFVILQLCQLGDYGFMDSSSMG